jgi:hypothetical protein
MMTLHCALSTVLQIQVTYLVHLDLPDLINKLIVYKSYPCPGLDRQLGLQEAEAHRISRQSAHEGCHPYAPADYSPLPFPQEILLVLISFGDCVDARVICGRQD